MPGGLGIGAAGLPGVGVPGIAGVPGAGTPAPSNPRVENPQANVPARPSNPGPTVPDGALGIPVVPGHLGVPLFTPRPCDPARVTTCPDTKPADTRR